MFDSKDVFNVFVIGPMNVADKEQRSKPIGRRIIPVWPFRRYENTKTIQLAVQKIFETDQVRGFLKDTRPVVEIPEQGKGNSIVEDVFKKIDDADLIIADLYLDRLSVYYELALAHSLGVPTIMLAKRSASDEFYLRNYRIHLVENYNPKNIIKELEAPIISHLSGDIGLFNNPIYDFYKNSILHLSTATGCAMAYYINFVRQVISHQGVLAKNPEYKKLYIMEADDFDNLDENNKLVTLLKQVAGTENINKEFERFAGDKRPLNVNVARDIFADGAATIQTLKQSPRYLRMAGTYGADSPIMRRMRKRMRIAFYDALRRQMAVDQDNIDATKCEILTFAQIEERLRPR